MLPDFLSHYYEADTGPFRSLSALSQADAAALLARLREDGVFAGQRDGVLGGAMLANEFIREERLADACSGLRMTS